MKWLPTIFQRGTRREFHLALKRMTDAEHKLHRMSQKYRILNQKMDNGIIILTKDGVPSLVAPSVTNVLGYGEADLLHQDIRTILDPRSVPAFNEAIAQALKSPDQVIECGLIMAKHTDDGIRYIEIKFTNLCDDPIIRGIIMNFRDVTLHKQTSDKLLYVNRLYSFISQINQAIVHTRDETALLQKACDIAVGDGGFRFAWIGSTKSDERSIEMIVSAGATQKDLDYFAGYTYDAGGPIDNVVKGDGFFVVDDIENRSNNNFMLYAHERGFKSAICLPLKKLGVVVGTFNLYSADKDFFNPQEIQLLTEATGDISFAIDALESDRQRTIAEEKLKNSEFRLKQAQEIAHLGSWEVNLATGVAIWSDEALRIFGLPINEGLQSYQQWLSHIHPEDLDNVLEMTSNPDSATHAFFYRILRRDGMVRYLYSQTQTEFDGEGKPIALQGIIHDVTNAKVTEMALVESQANLRLIIDTIPQAIFASDHDEKIVFANKAFASILGLTAHEVVNKKIAALPGVRQFSDIDGNVDQLKESGVYETNITNSTGEERVVHVSKIPYSIPGQSSANLLTIATDITERKQAESERIKMVADIVQRNKDLEQFSYIVSHNLRAPLANIMGLATELADDTYDDDIKAMLQQQLAQSTTRLDAVITDLTKILRLKNDITEEREEVNLAELITDIQSSLAFLLKSEHVSFKLDLNVKKISTLRSYQYSIFYNLISNSIKYRRPEVSPVIEIRSEGTKNGVKLIFKDNGLGIDMTRNENQLFGLYRRFHHHVEGKGIGLFMVKTQVETMGGVITVNSDLNSGTEFVIEYGS
ncbi:MAG TPA: PAS domain S-box protein [Flavobacterium sp.]|jgi:PAS domain S-box-containing protein